MKATQSVKVSFLIGTLLLSVLLFSPMNAFAATTQDGASAAQLSAINKKLDESQKREVQILAKQEKILDEIIKSRKWAHNNN